MSDLLSRFSTLQDEYYPGSKRKRRESQQMRRERIATERHQAREDLPWDARPKKVTVKQTGVDIEVFHIGALAKALKRNPITIRAWIRKGWLPRNMYQTNPVYGSRGDAGRRLWTRQQIEGIAQIAQEERLLDDKPPRPVDTRFTQRVFDAWKTWR